MIKKLFGLPLLAFLVCASTSYAATNSSLYTETFEEYPVGTPLVDNVSNQEWYASSTDAVVQADVVAPGSTQAAMVPIDVTLSNRYAALTSTNVWLSMQPRIVKYDRDAYPTYDTNATAMFYVDSNGYFVVRNGLVGWVTCSNATPISETNFYTIDVYLDYAAKTWRLVLDRTTLTNNIGFINTTVTNFTGFDVYNAGLSTSYLDNVRVYDRDMLPAISADPAGLTNEAVYGADASDQSFNVVSRGDGTIDYYIVTNSITAGWSMRITNDAAVGTLTNNATNTVWVKYTTASKEPGTYSNSFNIVSTNYEGQTQRVDVVIRVRGMTVTPTNFSNSKMIGYAASTQSFDIFQTGDGSISYTITTNPAVPWLSVSPGSGTVTTNETNTVLVSYYTNGLSVGITNAVIDVTADDNSVTQHIAVSMSVYSRPIPTPSFTTYSQTIQKGASPATTNLDISNTAGNPVTRMYYTVTSDVPWMTVNTNGMTTSNESSTVSVTFGDMSTNSGSYTGHLTVNGTDAGTGYTPTGQVTVSTQVTVNVLIIAPGKPTGLSATKATYTNGVYLVWHTTTNADHFELWRGTNSNPTNSTRFVSSVSSTSYVDATVSPGIRTYYWARAVNASGGSGDYSDSDQGWIYLNAPTDISASDGDYTNKVAVTWTAARGALTYQVWRSTVNLTNTAVLLGTVTTPTTSYNDTSAAVETVYYYWARSCTPDMGTFSESTTGYRSALLKPAGVLASEGEFTNKVRVIWQAVQNAQTYEVWRSANTNRSSAVQIGSATATGYDDEAVPQGVYYYYWIRAANYEGYSRFSDSDRGWRQFAPPSGISATRGSYPYRIRVSWNASENATGYEVWRGQGTGEGAKGAVAKVDETLNTYYDDHSIINKTAYYYRVKAKGALGSSDYSTDSDFGWREIAAATVTSRTVKNDYDGDRLADLAIYNSTSGVWEILLTSIGQYNLTYGSASSQGVAGDYDGDKISDPMLYWPSSGDWLVMLSSIGYYPLIAGRFGGAGADSAPADYDGDDITDLVVYNESSGLLSVLFSNGGAFNSSVSVSLGGSGWAIASADYDGDGKADPAVYSASAGQLVAKLSGSGYPTVTVPIGGAGVTMHPADYDGDAIADLVTYEETTGNWIAKLSSAGYATIPFSMGGGTGYLPIVSDYDGDSKTDPALYNESAGAWLIKFSGSGYPTIEDTYGGTNWVPVGR